MIKIKFLCLVNITELSDGTDGSRQNCNVEIIFSCSYKFYLEAGKIYHRM
jgi:hypothetical protein